jgi:glycosyltransferase involved in cell wall biosynthesis
MNFDISIIIPVYNAENTIDELYKRIVDSLGERSFQIIFIDDCSEDQSWDKIKKLGRDDSRISAIQLINNIGQSNATLLGFRHSNGKYIVTIDDDLEHPPEQIVDVLNLLISKPELDALVGFYDSKTKNLVRYIFSNINNTANSILFDKPRKLKMGTFRIIRHNICKAILKRKIDNPAIGTLLYTITNKIENFEVKNSKLKKNKSRYTIAKIFELFLNNSLGLTNYGLRYLLFIGIVGSTISLSIGVWSIIKYLLYGNEITGWTSLIVLISFFATFSFFAIGIVGELIFKTYRLLMNSNEPVIRDEINIK